jgi:hypothetical protein
MVSEDKIGISEIPPITDRLADGFSNYQKGKPLSQAVKPRVPSGQWWNDRTPSERQEWRETVEFLGESPNDLLHEMQRRLPRRNPKGLEYTLEG